VDRGVEVSDTFTIPTIFVTQINSERLAAVSALLPVGLLSAVVVMRRR